jgi:hypothetical protein
MAKSQRRDLDGPWKETLQHFLPYILAFFFKPLHDAIDWGRGYESLDKEFQQIIRRAKVGKRLADKLFKVWLKSGREAWLLIHVEIQGGVEKGFPRRMFEYNYRCYDLYQRRVVSLAILCDDDPNWRPKGFAYGGWGSKMGLRFPAAKLLDYARQQEALEHDPNPVAQVVLAHLKAEETRRDPEQRRHWKIRLVRGLYERGWSAEDVRQLLRILDWIMDLPEELQSGFREEIHRYEEEKHMPYVTSFERMAKKEGQRETWLKAIQLGLKKKFGVPGTRLFTKIKSIEDLDRLSAIATELMTADQLESIRKLLG